MLNRIGKNQISQFSFNVFGPNFFSMAPNVIFASPVFPSLLVHQHAFV